MNLFSVLPHLMGLMAAGLDIKPNERSLFGTYLVGSTYSS